MHLFTDSSENTYSTVHPGDDMTSSAGAIAITDIPVDTALQAGDLEGTTPADKQILDRPSWRKWYAALKHILPVYIAIHLAIFVTSCLAFLFTVKDFSPQGLPIATLWQQWHYWDTSNFTHIALFGYYQLHVAGFFPLYPMLERLLMFVTHDPLAAGLIISNIAALIMFTALYRLVEEDFNGERAYYAVLYFAIFPSAFFFSAAYSESVFLCLSILSFYHSRHGRWWLAGLFGFLASLTRPDGMFLLAPFCYEYLRRIWLQQGGMSLSGEQIIRLLKGIRFDILIGLCIPAGVALYAAYCYYQFHDPLAFVHAHADWNRSLHFPGWSIVKSIVELTRDGFLSFLTMRNAIDLGADLLVLGLIVLIFIGPWKLPKSMWSYGLYAVIIYLYFQFFPVSNTDYPLESMARFVLEVFPAFIMLARISKYRTLHLSYCMVSGAILFFLLTQFLIGHWVI
jgi:hypothetical protein